MAAKRGRPTDYTPEFCQSVEELAGNGATDIEMADACGVHVRTYYHWQAKYPEFRHATKAAKESADDRH